ncbi:hypothetical protein [Dyadobacter sp. BHUBP1]
MANHRKHGHFTPAGMSCTMAKEAPTEPQPRRNNTFYKQNASLRHSF